MIFELEICQNLSILGKGRRRRRNYGTGNGQTEKGTGKKVTYRVSLRELKKSDVVFNGKMNQFLLIVFN